MVAWVWFFYLGKCALSDILKWVSFELQQEVVVISSVIDLPQTCSVRVSGPEMLLFS